MAVDFYDRFVAAGQRGARPHLRLARTLAKPRESRCIFVPIQSAEWLAGFGAGSYSSGTDAKTGAIAARTDATLGSTLIGRAHAVIHEQRTAPSPPQTTSAGDHRYVPCQYTTCLEPCRTQLDFWSDVPLWRSCSWRRSWPPEPMRHWIATSAATG